MADNSNHQSSPGIGEDKMPSSSKSYFDFVVAKRPVYVPNSGPPLQPISLLLPHDKPMLIQAEIQLSEDPGRWVYQVYDPEKPGLRVSVRPEKILDWVSPRTLENWELDKPARQEREREELKQEKLAEAAKRRSKKLKKKKKKKSRATTQISKNDKRRLTTNAPISAGPGRKRRVAAEEELVFTSPTTTNRKPKGPSLSTPAKNISLITEDEDEDEDTDAVLIAEQLHGAVGRTFGPFKSAQPTAASTPLRAPSTPTSVGRQASRQPPAKSPLFSSRYAEASASSIQFRKDLEELEQETPRRNGERSIRDKYPNWARSPTMFKKSPERKAALTHIKNPFLKKQEDEEDMGEDLESVSDVVMEEIEEEVEQDEAEEEASQSEYGEVEEILNEREWTYDDGTWGDQFWIKWVGWGHESNTWEPEGNLNSSLVAEYRKKRRERRSRSSTAHPSSHKNRTIKSESATPSLSGLQLRIQVNARSHNSLFVSDDDDDDSDKDKGNKDGDDELDSQPVVTGKDIRKSKVPIVIDSDSDEF
ncbi:hypothetical protein HYALB_00002175 [Hymenoscyphus albidus]|uniref:Chromo domain-containing protein n=1 Tax=Hymenoscyphus albidus TaxID=595503 RepID=A0A9N9LQN4_9HELO|nr:hypothetical protein HYALB_00002175 [Hymenoscyphus albidus]